MKREHRSEPDYKPDRQEVAQQLSATFGEDIDPQSLEFKWSKWRWIAQTSSAIAYVVPPGENASAAILKKEALLIDMLAAKEEEGRITMPMQRHVDSFLLSDGAMIQIRSCNEGVVGDKPGVRQALDAIPEQYGAQLGSFVAQLHNSFSVSEAAPWTESFWPDLHMPKNAQSIRQELGGSLDEDPELKAKVLKALNAYEQIRVSADDLVLNHGDLSPQNMTFHPQTLDLQGVFDFETAHLGDRHWDFVYMAEQNPRMAQVAMNAYDDVTGQKPLSRERVGLYMVAGALTAHIRFLQNHEGMRDYMPGQPDNAYLPVIRHAMNFLEKAAVKPSSILKSEPLPRA